MSTHLKIDFVSDVACPWCAVGLYALQQALVQVKGDISAELHFQPFELNPDMGPEGQDLSEHLTQKYGSTAADQARIRETITARGQEVGFAFNPDGRGRVWNTFDAHRLLAWAEGQGEGAQLRLKQALLAAYHGRAEHIADKAVLLAAVREAGLNEVTANEVLDMDAYADKVRAVERMYQQAGVRSVPAIIINDKHLISGGQPAAVFEQALRQIAAQTAWEADE